MLSLGKPRDPEEPEREEGLEGSGKSEESEFYVVFLLIPKVPALILSIAKNKMPKHFVYTQTLSLSLYTIIKSSRPS